MDVDPSQGPFEPAIHGAVEGGKPPFPWIVRGCILRKAQSGLPSDRTDEVIYLRLETAGLCEIDRMQLLTGGQHYMAWYPDTVF